MAIDFTIKNGLTAGETISFYLVTCANCKVPFMLQEKHVARLKKTEETFYCPSGHTNFYNKSNCEKKKEELEAELKKTKEKLHEAWGISGKRASEVWQLKYANKELRKKQCPHCKKKFINIDQHIKKKHS